MKMTRLSLIFALLAVCLFSYSYAAENPYLFISDNYRSTSGYWYSQVYNVNKGQNRQLYNFTTSSYSYYPGYHYDETLTNIKTALGLAYDGLYLWVVSDESPVDTVHQYHLSGYEMSRLYALPSSDAKGLCYDGNNFWLVGGNTIYKLDSEFRVLSSFPAPSANPWGIASDGAYLYIADAQTRTVYKTSNTGNLLGNFVLPAEITIPKGLVFDSEDSTLWVADSSSRRIYNVSLTGALNSSKTIDAIENVTYTGAATKQLSGIALAKPSIKVYGSHPRLFFRQNPWSDGLPNPGLTIETLRQRYATGLYNGGYDAGNFDPPNNIERSLTENLAMAYLLTQKAEYAEQAIQRIRNDADAGKQYYYSYGGDGYLYALIYDWLYNYLDAHPEHSDVKEKLRAAVVKYCTDNMSGYNMAANAFYYRTTGWIAGYSTVALALDDADAPNIEHIREKAHFYFAETTRKAIEYMPLPPEGFSYDAIGGGGHQGYNKSFVAGMAWRSAVIEPRVLETSTFLRHSAESLMYSVKPDRSAASYSEEVRGAPPYPYQQALSIAAQLYADGGIQKFLSLYQSSGFAKQQRGIIYYDYSVPEAPQSREKLSYLIGKDGFGMLVMHEFTEDIPIDTTYGKDKSKAAFIAIKSGDYGMQHSHYDQGAFEIMKNGEKLTDRDGCYVTFDSDARFNYLMRSIAKNTIGIYDPNEQLHRSKYLTDNYYTLWSGIPLNDAGQREVRGSGNTLRHFEEYLARKYIFDRYELASIDYAELAQDNNNEYDYISTDFTHAYNNQDFSLNTSVVGGNFDFDVPGSGKAVLVNRQLVYLRPDYLVIHDRIESSSPDFEKRWIIHTKNKPKTQSETIIKGNYEYGILESYNHNFTVSERRAKLFDKVLLPLNPIIRKIGGSKDVPWSNDGYELYVDGKNRGDFLWNGVNDSNCVPDRADPFMYYDYRGIQEGGTVPPNEYFRGHWRVEVVPREKNTFDNFLNAMYMANPDVALMPETVLLESATQYGAQIKDPQEERIVMFAKFQQQVIDTAYRVNTAAISKHLIVDMVPNTACVVNINGSSQTLTSSAQGTLYFIDTAIGPHTVIINSGALVNPAPAAQYDGVDKDGDGYYAPESASTPISQPDYFDSDQELIAADIHPGAAKNPANGYDNDCNGVLDYLEPSYTDNSPAYIWVADESTQDIYRLSLDGAVSRRIDTLGKTIGLEWEPKTRSLWYSRKGVGYGEVYTDYKLFNVDEYGVMKRDEDIGYAGSLMLFDSGFGSYGNRKFKAFVNFGLAVDEQGKLWRATAYYDYTKAKQTRHIFTIGLNGPDYGEEHYQVSHDISGTDPVGTEYGLAYGNSSFWLLDRGNNTIYQMRQKNILQWTSEPEVMKSFLAPGIEPTDLAWNGSELLVSSKEGKIYFVDTSGTITKTIEAPGMNLTAIAFQPASQATPAVAYGDVSGNGEISANDASLAAQYAVGLITLTPEQITKADVSGNGEVSAADASLIAQKAVGLINKFPVEE